MSERRKKITGERPSKLNPIKYKNVVKISRQQRFKEKKTSDTGNQKLWRKIKKRQVKIPVSKLKKICFAPTASSLHCAINSSIQVSMDSMLVIIYTSALIIIITITKRMKYNLRIIKELYFSYTKRAVRRLRSMANISSCTTTGLPSDIGWQPISQQQ